MKYCLQLLCTCVLAIGLFTACAESSTTSNPTTFDAETEVQTVPATEDL